ASRSRQRRRSRSVRSRASARATRARSKSYASCSSRRETSPSTSACSPRRTNPYDRLACDPAACMAHGTQRGGPMNKTRTLVISLTVAALLLGRPVQGRATTQVEEAGSSLGAAGLNLFYIPIKLLVAGGG